MTDTAWHDAREQVAAEARALSAAGAFIGTAGNLSVKAGENIAITGTGVVLADCRPSDVTIVDGVGAVVFGTLEPSSELDLHLGVYASSIGAGAVVHTHAPFSTAVACAVEELPVIHYQQLSLGGEVRVAPYATFGTAALAQAVAVALTGRQAALMRSHGSVATGKTLRAAADNALLLEWLAVLYLRASQLGPPHVLTAQEQEDVIVAAIERGYGTPRTLTSPTENQELP